MKPIEIEAKMVLRKLRRQNFALRIWPEQDPEDLALIMDFGKSVATRCAEIARAIAVQDWGPSQAECEIGRTIGAMEAADAIEAEFGIKEKQ